MEMTDSKLKTWQLIFQTLSVAISLFFWGFCILINIRQYLAINIPEVQIDLLTVGIFSAACGSWFISDIIKAERMRELNEDNNGANSWSVNLFRDTSSAFYKRSPFIIIAILSFLASYFSKDNSWDSISTREYTIGSYVFLTLSLLSYGAMVAILQLRAMYLTWKTPITGNTGYKPLEKNIYSYIAAICLVFGFLFKIVGGILIE